MGPWVVPAAFFLALALLLTWFAHTDGKQAARVEARLPGAIAFRVFSNSRWSIWPQVQKKFGVHA
ncbi:MAG: hypothetical protein FWF16_12115, partial [Microbacteriaceae bacterium]|nr:hypothetical protein [Microbacteriaceae bacterium]